MFRSLCDELRQIYTKPPKTHLHQYPSLRSFSSRQNKQNPDISLIDDLKNSCGLSSEKALSVSKTLQNKNLGVSDSVLTFLKNNGFSKAHIPNLVSKYPRILGNRVESTLAPKIQFLKQNGFSKSEIVDVLSSDPFVLTCHLDKRVKPFFAFIQSVSDTKEHMKDKLRHYSCLLKCEKRVVTNVNLLKTYEVPSYLISELLLTHPKSLMVTVDRFSENLKLIVEMGFGPSDPIFKMAVQAMAIVRKSWWDVWLEVSKSLELSNEAIVSVLWRQPALLKCILNKRLVTNINLLKKYGVPNHLIAKALINSPRSTMLNWARYTDNLKVVAEMGFKPSTNTFMKGVRALSLLSKSTWDAKFKLYKSLGWSEEEIVSAFRRQPTFIMMSKEKISNGMDFFVKELGWGPSVISIYPMLLMSSLENRIVPRLIVLRALKSKDLVKDSKSADSFIMADNCFFEKFVRKHQKKFPKISKIYQAGLDGQLTLSDYKNHR